MPNGRPGDHPYTDIVIDGSSSEVGPEISDTVRELARLPGFDSYRDEGARLMESCSSHWGNNPDHETLLSARGRLAEIKTTFSDSMSE